MAADDGDEQADGERPDDHLADVEDGCGCVELAAALAERREE